jgi:hypothetical protein
MSVIDQYPEWMGKKEGRIIFTESDWPTTIGFKWGTFVTGAGTVLRDADHGVGGTGSVRLTTGAVTDDIAELKRTIPFYVGDGKIAFEMKWMLDIPAFGASTYEFGVELHNSALGLFRAKFQYTVDTDEWRFESATDVFTSFSPTIVISEPRSDSAAGGPGDEFGWARFTIDIARREYVSFEAAGKGVLEIRNMIGTPIPNTGAATADVLLFFAFGSTAFTTAEDYLTTDWATTVIN